ncbi:MAG: HlyC/CorC family transporter [Candidatus Protistobacter heckmanni]|nr:HlyC/CorC family transporter [Candidatus Protistobacter heckmanni]
MDNWPLWAQIGAVALLLCVSAFFSISETSMMALNRHRLRHLAKSGNRGARKAQGLLARTDELLSVILIGNNLLNTVLPVLTTGLAVYYFGGSATVVSIATGIVAVLIIVFAEIAPKVVGAAYPERIALPASHVLLTLVKAMRPVVWVVNLAVGGVLRLLRIDTRGGEEQRLSPEELRTLMLENSSFIPRKHRSILLNLFDLEDITVDDIMTPRARVEMLDLGRPIEEVLQQLETCYHNKLPVCDGDPDRVIGMLHVRRVLSLLGQLNAPSGQDAEHALTHDDFRAALAPAYYIPSGTPVFQQLQYFQENRVRLGLIVNEYGEVQGLVTLEDILEEMIGEFTTSQPSSTRAGAWEADGSYLADGGMQLRTLNRKLGLSLPLDGPKTLNGLLLETLREIPDASVSVRLAGCAMNIVQFDNQSIRTVRIHRPEASMPMDGAF